MCESNVRIAFKNYFALSSTDRANLLKAPNSEQYGIFLDAARFRAHNQNITVAASIMAERGTVGLVS